MTVVGVGVDLVDVERLRGALARRPALATRLFTDGERAYAGRHRDPAPRLAARFAAKEAVMKALGVGLGGLALRDVEVVRAGTVEPARSGRPTLVLHGRAGALAAAQGVERWQLSLSHTASSAIAVAVAVTR